MGRSINNYDQNAIEVDDETTPLLVSVQSAPIAGPADPAHHGQRSGSNDTRDNDEESIPLPLAQIVFLCCSRVVEPLAFFGIFPYINSMIEHVGGVNKEEVGFYSGLIESLFSATQMCVMIFWGKASDRLGRKPVLVFSLVGLAVSTTLFGMSQSLTQMILARCFGGIFAGTVVTIRTMLSENSTRFTQAQAFSYFAFAGNLGLFAGPLIGGALESPAKTFPSTFGKLKLFNDYPYVLPGMVTSIIALSAALLSLLFVKETLYSHRDKNKIDEGSLMTTWQLLKYPGVWQVLLIYNYVMLQAFTFTAVNPVFMYTPIELGGFGFSPKLIALFVALAGLAQAAWLLLMFPPLHKRVGTGKVLWYCAWAWPFFFAIHPVYNVLLFHGQRTFFFATGPVLMSLGSGIAMAFTAVQLALNDIAPSHETLGTLNSISLALTSGLRAVAPAASTSIFALGVKYQIFGGYLFWLTNILLAISLIGVLRLLPDKVKSKVERRQNRVA